MRTARKVVGWACGVLVMVGCVGEEPAPAPPDAVAPSPTEDGIDAETAQSEGVFAADGDAVLTIDAVEEEGGSTVVDATITNLGKVDDIYAVVLLSDEVAVGQREVPVAAGAAVHVTVTVDPSTGGDDLPVTHVRLDGTILGQGVALHPVG